MAKYTYTIWRRKTASAQVKLFEGKGSDMVNGKKITDYVQELIYLILFILHWNFAR